MIHVQQICVRSGKIAKGRSRDDPLILSKTLNVTEMTLNEPEIALVKSENGEKWNFSSIGGNNAAAPKSAPQARVRRLHLPPHPHRLGVLRNGASSNPNLSVAKLNVNNGRLTVSRAGDRQRSRASTTRSISRSRTSPFVLLPLPVDRGYSCGRKHETVRQGRSDRCRRRGTDARGREGQRAEDESRRPPDSSIPRPEFPASPTSMAQSTPTATKPKSNGTSESDRSAEW